MKKSERAYAGDQIKITNGGQRYDRYTDFFRVVCPEYAGQYDTLDRKHIPQNGETGTILFCAYDWGPTGHHDMYVIELDNVPGVCYLVNEKAFKIEMNASPLIEIDEVDMTSLFEVISCK